MLISVADPAIESDDKLIEFGVATVKLTCKSVSDENIQGTYEWRRNNITV